MKYIETIKELKKYIGKFVYFYYTDNGEKNGNIVFGWAKKITKIEEDYYFFDAKHPLKYWEIYGTHTMYFVDNEPCKRNKRPTPEYLGEEETSSNAQEFARELTATEKLLYRMYLKRQEAKKLKN